MLKQACRGQDDKDKEDVPSMQEHYQTRVCDAAMPPALGMQVRCASGMGRAMWRNDMEAMLAQIDNDNLEASSCLSILDHDAVVGLGKLAYAGDGFT